MSSVPTTVDVEAGSPLEGVELTDLQKLKLYNDGAKRTPRIARSQYNACCARGPVLSLCSRARSPFPAPPLLLARQTLAVPPRPPRPRGR